MSMQSEGKDAKGRNYHQITDGSTSAASMGAGSTGEVGTIPGPDSAQGGKDGNLQQSEQNGLGRTDDLLAGGSDDAQSDQGFQGEAGQQGSQSVAGTGSVQSGKPSQ